MLGSCSASAWVPHATLSLAAGHTHPPAALRRPAASPACTGTRLCLALTAAARVRAPLQGAFLGAMVAMSSTSIVVKVLTDYRAQNTQQGQITIGTLIMQARAHGAAAPASPVLLLD